MRADGTRFPIEMAVTPLEVQGRHLLIAFVRDEGDDNNVINTADLSGGGLTEVVDGDDPTWSSGGTLAFTGEGADGPSIFIMSEGSDSVEVVEGEAPSWSPDGTELAYVRGD